ncbi:anaerobic ribonucleoside-triphosphate reductase [Cellulosilyticum sp. I15G10I2]|uniref:anaerobic ribonucleoside-triphosphate reductase n=1 Tax=Cellulosilyticum sp. I15G10I2 TaxID=1892843 RepID=UPI00085CCB46|nr:anaerobic ribonucleoside-triphosphate reductase [Cellulosilyticum sp. I15G10I2]
MKYYVIKRDGRKVSFDLSKIDNAITRSAKNLNLSVDIAVISQEVENRIRGSYKYEIDVEQIQDLIEDTLMDLKLIDIKNSYSNYRKERTRIRDLKSELMDTVHSIGVETDRDNANVGNNFSSKLLRIASETNKWHNLSKMPKRLAKLHELGDLYYHDLDSYNLATNCLHIDTGKVFENGFNTGYGTIRQPKRIESAAELSCILLQASQNDMFGGQSHVNFDNDMAPYVKSTRDEIFEEYAALKDCMAEEDFVSFAESKLISRVRQAMQGIVYNLNTMHSRAGSQVPFSSLNVGVPQSADAALVCQIFLEEYEKGLGKNEQPIFPNIIFRVKLGVNRRPEDPYYYLFKLACKVAGSRMNPTFMNLDADFNLHYYNMGILPATMGCRTYICSNVNGQEGPNRRGNNAPTTINLPRIAIEAKGDLDRFWELLDKKLNLAKESLLYRYEVLKKLKVKDMPFVIGEGLMLGSEGLGPNDSIDPILKNGSWSIGFIGLAETLISLTGSHHGQSEKARELGYQIVQCMRDFTDKATYDTQMNWSCYATPAEGLSGKFVLQDRVKYGVIEGVTDKDYYTNSFHVPVGFTISIPDKVQIEAPFHKMCNAGHISYIEVDGYPEGDTLEKIITYAYDHSNISYLGINFHLRYCKDCGTYINEHSKTCPDCSGTNIQGISRVTGYLSLDERFGNGKLSERRDRLSHDGSNKNTYTSV